MHAMTRTVHKDLAKDSLAYHAWEYSQLKALLYNAVTEVLTEEFEGLGDGVADRLGEAKEAAGSPDGGADKTSSAAESVPARPPASPYVI